jgi:hypothetical protein
MSFHLLYRTLHVLIAFSIPTLLVFNNPSILKEISDPAHEKRIGRTDIFRPFKTNFLISSDHFMPIPAYPAGSGKDRNRRDRARLGRLRGMVNYGWKSISGNGVVSPETGRYGGQNFSIVLIKRDGVRS